MGPVGMAGFGFRAGGGGDDEEEEVVVVVDAPMGNCACNTVEDDVGMEGDVAVVVGSVAAAAGA